MSRPLKKGLEYFPFDCKFDDQFKTLVAVHKNDGAMWLIRFWQSAYQTENGEVDMNGSRGVFHADNSGITPEKQASIIETCLELNLLHEVRKYVYTSNGIQKRIALVKIERERWRKKDKNELSTRITPGECADNSGITPQKEKGKGKREKQSKDSSPPATQPEKPTRVRTPRDDVFDFVASHWGYDVKVHRTTIGKFASNFFDLLKGAGVEEIKRRHENYIKSWPEMDKGPGALILHWPKFEQDVSKTGKPITDLFKNSLALNQKAEVANG